jgi:putative ABC transport system ATP-binding protein
MVSNMIRLNHIKYKNIIEIDNLNIASNAFACLIGHSGSGKTTLLKIMARLISVDQGDVFFDEQNIKTYPMKTYREQVLYLTQKPYLFQGNVKHNLVMGLKYHQIDYQENELINILKYVQLNKKLDDDVEHFSGGEAQRLALARLLLLKPKLLLLDEPTAQFDQQLEQNVMDLLKKLNQEQNITIVMATHHIDIAKKYATQIIDLKSKGSEKHD